MKRMMDARCRMPDAGVGGYDAGCTAPPRRELIRHGGRPVLSTKVDCPSVPLPGKSFVSISKQPASAASTSIAGCFSSRQSIAKGIITVKSNPPASRIPHLASLFFLLYILLYPLSIAKAQQRAQYSQYMNNQMLLNPAVAGTAEAFDIRVGGRLQWAGFKDAPHSFYVAMQTPVGKPARGSLGKSRFQKSHYFGFGAIATADVTGPTSRTGFYAAGSFNKAFTKTIRASFGVFAGLQQFALNADKLIYADQSAGRILGFSKVFPDAGVGMWVYSKQFYVGGSILQIFRNQFSTYDASSGIYVANRHMFLTTGYNFQPKKGVEIQPSIMVKKVAPAPWSVDFNVRLRFDQSFWVGTSYRTSDALVLMAGFSLNHQVDFGYSYDAVLSDIGRFTAGSHEVFLGYRVGQKRRVNSPSDFWK